MPHDYIYLDNAATSWPKPASVSDAMTHFIQKVGANPGRSAHSLSIASGRIVDTAREAVCRLFGATDPLRVAFGANATEAINLVLYGFLNPGDHVIVSAVEHNAVMRPLRHLESQGVKVSIAPCDKEGRLNPKDLAALIKPNTTLVAVTHASNVTGTLLPISEIGQITRGRGIYFLVDTAATGGTVPIEIKSAQIDFLAFTGHKSLLGPMGTGGLVLGDTVDVRRIRPLKRGGTGSRSEEEHQPDILPDKFESGTPNTVGLAGLTAGIEYILDKGIPTIQSHHRRLTGALIDGLSSIRGVTIHGPRHPEHQTAVVSLSMNNVSPAELGYHLDEEYGILTRVGLHCAPAAHKTINTFPTGTVRLSLGVFTQETDISKTVDAVKAISSRFSDGTNR